MENVLSIAQKKEIVQKNGGRPGNILGMLLDFQKVSGQRYVDREAVVFLAEELKMSEARVFELASYYAMLETKPQAKYVLMVCNSSPCQFSKADEVTAMLKDILGVEMGKSTGDGMFLYHYTPCVGACDIGPVIKVGDKVFGNLDKEKVTGLIEDLRAGKIEV